MAKRKRLTYEAHQEIAVDLKLARRLIIDNYVRVGNGLPHGKVTRLAAKTLQAIDTWRTEMENVMCADYPDNKWEGVWRGDPQDRQTLLVAVSERVSS